MTSKISIDNRELLQKISIGEAAAGIDFGNAIVRELAAFRLAAMDSKPVQMFGIGSIFKPQRVIEQEADCDDCAHYNPKICHGEGCPAISQQSAQPAPVVPVVPDVMEPTIEAIKRILPTSNPDEYAACIGADMWNACRAAMLQELQKSAGASNNCRSGENVQDLLAGNCRENGNSSTNNFREIAETSTNYPATPDCWCRTCRPVVLNDMRFVVCPDCGNKRCPKANDHRNDCSGSNEPGQEGSAYPAAPQEVKGEHQIRDEMDMGARITSHRFKV